MVDLVCYIANGKIDGEYLPYKELISYYTIAATAGHDNTCNALSSGLHALRAKPAQMQSFKGIFHDENPLKLVVDEMIRWPTPLAQFSRTAMQGCEVGG
jgi:cytochrome P450